LDSNNTKKTIMKTLLKISLIAAIALTINSCESKNSSQTANNCPELVTEKFGQSESEKPIVKEDPAVSVDSIKSKKDTIRREMERERERYAKEQARFAKVLKEASDEELFVMLNYAIANHFVPNRDIDPFYNMHVMVGCWQRSLIVYNNLSGRKDLLKKIYPDLKVLDEYVNWGRDGEPYPDTNVSKTIMDNAKKECQGMDYRLVSKFFGTPLMRD
jgi:hypothetical protein